jgi:ubiquinone biosynthesis protein
MMLDWNWLVGESVIGALLPAAYARYRRPIAEALRLFLSRLPEADTARILSDQAALAAGASAEERLVALAERCPALHKLGQVLARDRRLAPELRGHLQRLESLPATTPIEAVSETIRRELGPLDQFGVQLDPPALAEASVAVVVPFERLGGEDVGLPRRGVFKVLKPGIEDRLTRELSLLQEIGSFLDDRCVAFAIPPLEYREVFDQVREKLETEVDLRGEQRHLRQAAETYAREPEVVIPRLYPFCSGRVTAMERIDGQKVTEPGQASRDRRRLAGLIVEALIAGPIWSPASTAVFHADPHAGNLFATPDQRLAILDWSLVGTLGEFERIAMTQILLGAFSLDAARIRAALLSLAQGGGVDEFAFEQVISESLRKIRHGVFPGFGWLMGIVDDAVLRSRLRPRSDLILFRKALLTLEGVLADVSGEVRIDDLLPVLFFRRLAAEWPGRLLTSPLSRSFETRISNEDLALLVLRLPSTPARAWVENCLEALSSYSASG